MGIFDGCKFAEGGSLVGPDGCYWDSKEDYLQCHVWMFCGCGSPEDNLIYVRDALLVLEWWNQKRSGITDGFDIDWGVWQEKLNVVFGNKLSEAFMWYWLDEKGYTEHGSSIPGWLTDKGKEMLAVLIESFPLKLDVVI